MAKTQSLGSSVLKMQKQVIKMSKAYETWDSEQDEAAKQIAKQKLDIEHNKLKELNTKVSELQS